MFTILENRAVLVLPANERARDSKRLQHRTLAWEGLEVCEDLFLPVTARGASGPISRRGWQDDGCLNEIAYFQYVKSIHYRSGPCEQR